MNLLLNDYMRYVALFAVCMLFTIPAIWSIFFSTSLFGTLSRFLDNFLKSREEARHRKEQTAIGNKADRYVTTNPYPLDAYFKLAFVLLPILLTSGFAYYEFTSLFSGDEAEEKVNISYAGAEMTAAYNDVGEEKTVALNAQVDTSDAGTPDSGKMEPAADTSSASSHPGEPVFSANCASCHQADGKGLPGAFPPLSGSEWVTHGAEIPVKILMHGLAGEIEVEGNTYNGIMPSFGATLSDQEIADVVSYVRSSFGNDASSVDADFVAKIRKETETRTNPWSPADLK